MMGEWWGVMEGWWWGGCVCMYVHVQASEWECEWVSEWVSGWVSECTLSHACHAKEAETQGRQRNPGAYIRPLDSAHCLTPATQKRRRPRDTSGTPGRTSATLTVHIVPRLPRKRGGDPGTPAEPRGVHPTPWQCTLSHACHAKEAETQGHQRNPGAYIRHLDSAHCPTPATQKRRRPRDASGTPGRTSDPLTVHIVPRLPRKRGGDSGTPAEPRGVHPTPWQCTLSHACHAKEAETQGRQRNPGAYIRPLDSAHCPTPATQKRRRPRDASGTPGRTSDPLTVHIVWRRPWCVWVIEWVSECVSEWVIEWVSEWVREWVRWVSEWEWVSGWVREEDGRRRRKADTELKTKTPHVNVGNNQKKIIGPDNPTCYQLL